MPKTRNAYALRDFDEKRILQRPFFRDLHFDADKTDEEILKSFEVTLIDSADDMETKQKNIKAIHTRLGEYQILIKRQSRRVGIFNRKKAEKLGIKVSELEVGEGIQIAEYFFADLSVVELLEKFKKGYYEIEEKIEARYRQEFATRLRSARRAAGLTQKQLGDMIQISPNGYSQYETGKRDPSIPTIFRLLKILPMEKLLGITKIKTTSNAE